MVELLVAEVLNVGLQHIGGGSSGLGRVGMGRWSTVRVSFRSRWAAGRQEVAGHLQVGTGSSGRCMRNNLDRGGGGGW